MDSAGNSTLHASADGETMVDSAEQTTVWEEPLTTTRLLTGGAAGVFAGLFMGTLLQFGTETLEAIGSMAGPPSLLVGWVVLIVTAGLFGVLFVPFVALPLVRSISTGVRGMLIAGILHAMVLSFVTIGVLLPVATEVLGSTAPSLADVLLVPGPGLGQLFGAFVFGLAHLVYGAVLGLTYETLTGH